ncbi:MAG: hypothetical protein RL318_2846 [Fibrobacterota bacterium]|jgi:fucose 4-O-acetylase-like acetyltransferase
MSTQREMDIDVAKGLGILLVAAGHTPLWTSLGFKWVGMAIFSFHMPLFLFLSGLFLPARQNLSTVLLRRGKGLLLPYVLACAVFLATGEYANWPSLFGRIGWATGQSIGWPWTPIWFLPHLFLCIVVAWAHLKAWDRLGLARWKWVCLFVLLLILTRQIFDWEDASDFELWERELGLLGLPWSLDILPASLVFLLGAHLWGRSLLVWTRKWWSLPVFLGLATFWYWRYAWSINFNVRTYDHLAGSTTMAMLGILAVMALASLLAGLKIPALALSSLGRASLWILVSHAFLQSWTYAKLWDESTGPTPDRYLAFGFLIGWCLPWGVHSLRERLPVWWRRLRHKEIQ